MRKNIKYCYNSSWLGEIISSLRIVALRCDPEGIMDDINLSPLAPVFHAQKLDALISLWLKSCRKRLAKYTVDGYEDDIAHFRRWWSLTGPSLDWHLHQEDLLAFNSWLSSETSLGYHSRNDCLRKLKQMFRWAHKGNYVKADYSGWIPQSPGSAPLRTIANASALVSIMTYADEPLYRVALAVLIGTGMRRAECATLRVEDVRLNADGTGVIIVHQAKQVRSREIQQRQVVVDAGTGAYLRPWLDSLPANSVWLFPSTTYPDRHIVPRSLARGIKRIIRRAGVEGIQGPHDIRRIYITENRRQQNGGAADHSLQLQVGHASTATTDRYDYQTEDDMRRNLVSPFAVSAKKC